jgi:Bacterial SH3 domain
MSYYFELLFLISHSPIPHLLFPTLSFNCVTMFTNLLKYILGVVLALGILVGGGVASTIYVLNRNSINPAKPVFDNDSVAVKESAPLINADKTKPNSNSEENKEIDNKQEDKKEAEAKDTKEVKETPKAKETPQVKETPKELPPGAYEGRVSWPQGLSLRKDPTSDAEKIGGVGFNNKVTVVEESSDKVWIKIRLEGSDQEGWVKAGNVKQVDGGTQDNKPATDETNDNPR